MKKLKMVIPKGRLFDNIAKLLKESGIGLETNDRVYIPHLSDPEMEAKIMKPQNIAQLIELGSHDIGFTGYDWLVETEANVIELMDLKLNPVKIVAAIPEWIHERDLHNRKIVVASEYENISTRFLQSQNYDYLLLRTFGATEAFPPQDADMIIDNISTGQTLKDHKLKTVAEIMTSSTFFIANAETMNDKWKKEKIGELKMLFSAVLNAKDRVMLEMNVPREKLEVIVKILPCMRAPTVAPLYNEEGFAVKVAVEKREVAKLIPIYKNLVFELAVVYSHFCPIFTC